MEKPFRVFLFPVKNYSRMMDFDDFAGCVRI